MEIIGNRRKINNFKNQNSHFNFVCGKLHILIKMFAPMASKNYSSVDHTVCMCDIQNLQMLSSRNSLLKVI